MVLRTNVAFSHIFESVTLFRENTFPPIASPIKRNIAVLTKRTVVFVLKDIGPFGVNMIMHY